MRKQIAAANWKMNLTYKQGKELLEEIMNKQIILEPHKKAIFAIPFPYLRMARKKVKERENYEIAAQNCHHLKSGAYTGEVSAEMIHSMGVGYVVIGHSERRAYFNETDALLAEKVNIAIRSSSYPHFLLRRIFACQGIRKRK